MNYNCPIGRIYCDGCQHLLTGGCALQGASSTNIVVVNQHGELTEDDVEWIAREYYKIAFAEKGVEDMLVGNIAKEVLKRFKQNR